MMQIIETAKMTPEQFVYWLQGALELPGCALTKREQMIKDHLAQVFTKKTPDYPQMTYTTTNPILPDPQFPGKNLIC